MEIVKRSQTMNCYNRIKKLFWHNTATKKPILITYVLSIILLSILLPVNAFSAYVVKNANVYLYSDQRQVGSNSKEADSGTIYTYGYMSGDKLAVYARSASGGSWNYQTIITVFKNGFSSSNLVAQSPNIQGSSGGTVQISPTAGNYYVAIATKNSAGTTIAFYVNSPIIVQEAIPNVSSISPTTATRGVSSTFTVYGSNLPSTIAMSLYDGNCGSPYNVTTSSANINCTPQVSGSKLFYVAQTSGGSAISGSPFTVQIVNPTASVSSISPTTSTLGLSTVFTVYGSNLPSTIAMSLYDGNCGSPYNVTTSSAQINCTPQVSGSKLFYVAQTSNGSAISGSPFTIQVVAPTLTNVTTSPTSGNSGTTFTFYGYLSNALVSGYTVTIIIEGSQQEHSMSCSGTTCSFSTPISQPGVNRVYTVYLKRNGSTVQTKSGTYTVNNQAPQISSQTASSSNGNVTVQFYASDPEGQSMGYEVWLCSGSTCLTGTRKINGSSFYNGTQTVNYSSSEVGGLLTNGSSYRARIWLFDNDGVKTEVYTSNFTYNAANQPPTVSVVTSPSASGNSLTASIRTKASPSVIRASFAIYDSNKNKLNIGSTVSVTNPSSCIFNSDTGVWTWGYNPASNDITTSWNINIAGLPNGNYYIMFYSADGSTSVDTGFLSFTKNASDYLPIDLSFLNGKKVGGALFLDASFCDLQPSDNPHSTFYIEKAGVKVAKTTVPEESYTCLMPYGNLALYTWTNTSGKVITNWSDILSESQGVSFRLLAQTKNGEWKATSPFSISYQNSMMASIATDKTFPQTGPDVAVNFTSSVSGGSGGYTHRWIQDNGNVFATAANPAKTYGNGNLWHSNMVTLEVKDGNNNITYAQKVVFIDKQYESGDPMQSGSGSQSVGGVDVSNGNFNMTMTDLEAPGKGVSFTLIRSYNSAPAVASRPWRFNVDMRLVMDPTKGNREIDVYREDGRKEIYYRDADGLWYSGRQGMFDMLRQNANGSFTLYTRGSKYYNFSAPDGKGYCALQSISDRDGNSLTFSGSGAQKTVTDASGRNYTLDYDANGRLTRATDFSGRFVQYAYNANGNLASFTDVLNKITYYGYSVTNPYQLVTLRDPNGTAANPQYYFLTLAYFSSGANTGKVQYRTDANGNVTEFIYGTIDGAQGTSVKRPATNGINNNMGFKFDNTGRVTEIVTAQNYDNYRATRQFKNVTDPKSTKEKGLIGSSVNPRNKTTAYGYSTDGRGNKTAVTNHLTQRTTMDFKTEIDLYPSPSANQTNLNLMKEMKSPSMQENSYKYSFGHTDTGNIQTITNPLNRVTRFDYTNGLIDQLTDPKGYTTGYTYYPNGNVRRVTDIAGNYVEYTYDTLGRTTDVRDKRGYITHYTYDAAGHVLTETRAYGTPRAAMVKNTYDHNGNLISLTDARDNTRNYTYDKMNQIKTESFTVNSQTYTRTYVYDELNRVKQVINENNHASSKTFDAAGRQKTEKNDVLNNPVTYDYDANGNVEKITDALGRLTTYTYDDLDRVFTQKDHLNNIVTYTYDADGRVKTFKDARNNITTYDYYADGSLWKVTDANVPAKVTEATYDEAGNLKTVKDPNLNTTTYGYDNLYRMTSMKDHANREWVYDYDPNGNLIYYRTPDNNISRYEYDELNRLTKITWPDSSTVAYTYDGNGNRKTMVDSSGTTNYTYDEANRLSSVTDSYGKTVSYTYDGVGNVKSMVYPGSKTVNYTYDEGERLATVANWLAATTTYTYNKINQITQILNGNGTKAIYSYDNANRLNGLQNQTSSGATITAHAYPLLDENGNVRQAVVDMPTLPSFSSENKILSYDAVNRIITAGATTFTHDTNGRIINETLSGQTLTYGYNYRDLLTSITGGTDSYAFAYNGDGNRISKTKNSAQTKYVLDVSGSLPDVLAETDATGNITSYYTYGAGLLSRIDASDNQEYFYHYDPTGNTLALTNSGQSIVASYGYSPYGETTATGAVYNPFRYSGKHGVMDDGNGLIHMRARYYKPSIARFMSLDPVIGDMNNPQSLNRYAYVQGDPINFTDPSGLSKCDPKYACCPKVSESKNSSTKVAVSKIDVRKEVEYVAKTLDFSLTLSTNATGLAGYRFFLTKGVTKNTAGNLRGMVKNAKAAKAYKIYDKAGKLLSYALWINDVDKGVKEAQQKIENGQGSVKGQSLNVGTTAVLKSPLLPNIIGTAAGMIDFVVGTDISGKMDQIQEAAFDPVYVDDITAKSIEKMQKDGTLKCATDPQSCDMNGLQHFIWMVGSALEN